MRLLIITQKVDSNDKNLGFFHRWLEEFAEHCQSIIVVCLQKGEYNLPPNVRVLSLGKETKTSKIRYLWNFYKYVISEHHNYDGVFVHMNKEYILLGGWLWKLWHKKVALWYTHKAVSWQLKLAEKLVDKIFTASKESFRLPSKKVEITGHGIPVEDFAEQNFLPPPIGELFLLSVGRISPSKDLETIIRAISELNKRKNGLPRFVVRFYGDPITEFDFEYKKKMEKLDKELNAGQLPVAGFKGSMPHEEMEKEYQSSHLLIHTSRTGSMDKVVLEALAAGRIVISSSEAYVELAKQGIIYNFPAGDHQALANKIEEIYKSGALARIPDQRAIDYVRKNHNLGSLIKKIVGFYVA